MIAAYEEMQVKSIEFCIAC